MSDTTAPTLTAVSIASNNSTKTNYACHLDSDVVTLTIAADESMNEPVVVFTSGGASVAGAVTYSGSGTSWTAAYTVDAADTVGVVGYTIDYSDTAGNAGTTVTVTTDDSKVTIVESKTVTNTETTPTTSGYQLGDDIHAEALTDWLGWSVSLSSDGKIVAMGAPYQDDDGINLGINSGHVRIYQYREYTQSDDDNGTYHYTSRVQNASQMKSLISTEDTSTAPVVGNSYWTQLGFDINAEADYDVSGYSVSLSSDGSIVAIGATDNNGNGSGAGHVRVYQRDESVSLGWRKLGHDIDGELQYDASGFSVSLSSDGSIVAIGARYNDGNGSGAGQVRVYQYREFTQIDSDNGTYHYTSRAQNATQTKPLIIAENTYTAPVVGYSYWTQLGADIDGEARDDRSGFSVSLSSDGTIVAIGADWNDGNGDKAGHVRVYQYNATKTTADTNQTSATFGPAGWNRLGSDIDGEAADDDSGTSVSLSSDGTIVAIGATDNDGNGSNSGHVRVYQRNESNTTVAPIGWTQLGDDIDGEAVDDYSGKSVSLSDDGSIVAISAWGNDANGSMAGHVRVYQYNATKTTAVTDQSSATFGPAGWNRLGDDIDGKVAGDQFGFSVSLSSDGAIVACGSPFDDVADGNAGHVSVFQTGVSIISTTTPTVAAIPPDITGLTIVSNNTDNTAFATTGNTITIDMIYDLPLTQAPFLAIQSGGADINNAVAVSGADTTWTATYNVNAADTEGIVTFTIDASGNYADQQTTEVEITNASSMTINKAAPTFTSIVNINDDGLRVTFSENVFSTNTGSGDLEVSDFVLSIDSTSTDLTSTEPSSITKISDAVYDLSFSLTNTVSTSTTVTLNPANGSSIYDSLALAMVSPQTSNNTVALTDIVAPTFTSIVNINDAGLRVTFSENVFNTNTGSGDLEVSDFVLSIDSTSTDLTSTEPSSITKISDAVYDLSFSLTNTVSTPTTVTLNPANGSSIYDAGGISLVSPQTSNNTVVLIDTVAPTFTSIVNINDSGLRVTFSENVFSTNTGSGDLEVSDFVLSIDSTSTDLTSTEPSSIAKISDAVYDLSFSLTNTVSTSTTVTLNPANGSSIYDAGGIAAISTQTSNNTVALTDIGGPTLTSVSIASNNSTKTNYAWYGDSDVVTLTITANEIMNEPVVVFTSGGASVAGAVTYSGSGTSWTAAYTVDVADTIGLVGYIIIYSDTIGNSGIAVTNTTDDSQVTIISGVSITSGFQQLGTDLDGSNTNDEFGDQIALSTDGLTLAVASDGPNSVHIYGYNGSSWIQKGATLYANGAADSFGRGLSLSYDGSIVCIGAESYNSTSNVAMAVYEYNGSSWIQKGSNIYHNNTKDSAGASTAISKDGNVIAMGIPAGDKSGLNQVGIVRVFQFVGSDWSQKGSDIYGDTIYNYFGRSVSLNHDGSIVGGGSNEAYTTDGRKGAVKVYSFNSGSWVQMGDTLLGNSSGDSFGFAHAMSYYGTTIVAGAYQKNVGYAKVYEYNGSSWIQKGNQINGANSLDYFGWSVAINRNESSDDDGNTIVIGAIDGVLNNTDSNTGNGYSISYKYQATTNTWDEQNIILGESSNNSSGYDVGIDKDGDIIAVGAPYTNGKGDVRVFGGSSSVYAFIPADITTLTIVTDNYNTAYATNGNTVSINMVYDLALSQAPTVTVQSGNVDINNTVTVTGTDTNWTAVYTVHSTDTEGSVTFNISALVNYGDENAITESSETDITNYSSVLIDQTSPTISGLTNINDAGLRVTFSENVFSTNTGSGDLEVSDFVLSIDSTSTDLTSTTPSSISKISGNVYDLSFSLTNTVSTSTTVTLNPTNGSSIYDIAGLSMVTPQPSNNTVALTDIVSPTLSTVSIASNNSIKTDYASHANSDVVTLTITSNENINQPIVIFTSGGDVVAGSVSYSGSDAIWYASYIVDITDTIGQVGYTITYTDTTGNVGPSVTSTTNNSKVTIVTASTDGTNAAIPPLITTLTIISNNTNDTSSATVDDTVTIYMTYDLALPQEPSLVIQSGGINITNPITITGSELSWTASFVVNSLDNDGIVTFAINASGNYADQQNTDIDITNGSVVLIDVTPPTFSNLYSSKNNNVRITFSKPVYSTSSASGVLEISDFTITSSGPGTLLSNIPSAISPLSDSNYTIYDLSYGIVESNFQLTTIAVQPTNGNSIFNRYGLPMLETQLNNTFNIQTLVTITDVGIKTDNTNSIYVGTSGDTVIIDTLADISMNHPDVAFTSGGIGVSNNTIYEGEGTTWKSSYVISTYDSAGIVGFTIDYKDLSGNIISSTTNNTSVRVETDINNERQLYASYGNANYLKSMYVQGFIDVSGGNIELRGENNKLQVPGNVTLNRAYLQVTPSEVAYVDTTIPVITLLGFTSVTIAPGANYEDAGATAYDNYDGDITSSIVVDSNVDTSVVGTYIVTYNVSDSAGNAAIEVSRIVYVDTTAPVITILGSTSVTVEYNSIYTDAGATASDNNDGDITDNIVVVNNVNTSTLGNYSVTYNVTDAAGNIAAEVTRVVYVVDGTEPTITLLGDAVVTIEYNTAYNDAGATAIDNYDGDITDNIVIVGDNIADTSTKGTHIITYNVTDSAGNAAIEVSRTVNIVDTAPPVLTLLGESSFTSELGSAYIDAGATAYDDYDGDISNNIIVFNNVNKDITGRYEITYNVTDTAGNAATEISRLVYVLNTSKPLILLIGAEYITLEYNSTYQEFGASGININDDDLSGDIVVSGDTVDTSTLGTYIIRYNLSEFDPNTGNTNYADEVVRTVYVVDGTEPIISLIGDATVTVECQTIYTDAGATASDNHDGDISSSIVIVNNVNTSILGTYIVSYNVTDAAGNVAIEVTRTVNVVDTTPPIITLLGDATLNIQPDTAPGAVYSDAGATAIDILDGDVTANIVIVNTVDITTEGSYTVTYNVSDAAGNAAIEVVRTVIVDGTPPVITVLGSNPLEIEKNGSYSDPGATSDTGETVTASGTVNTSTVGTYTITYTATDAAGNTGTATRTVDVIEPPGLDLPMPTYNYDFRQTISSGSSIPSTGTNTSGAATFVGLTATPTNGMTSTGNLGQYISMSAMTIATNVTVECYIKHNAIYSYGRIFTMANNRSDIWTNQLLYIGRNGVQYAVRSAVGNQAIASDLPDTLNTWDHYVLVLSSQYIALYKNGVFGSSKTHTKTIDNDRPLVYIGRQWNNENAAHLICNYKYCRIWIGTTMTAAQISTMYGARESAFGTGYAGLKTYLLNATRIGVGINRTPDANNALAITGTTHVSNNFNVGGNLNLHNLNIPTDMNIIGALNIGTNAATVIVPSVADDVTVNSRLFINANNSSYNNSIHQIIHSDVNGSGTFSSDVSLNSHLVVPGNVIILDGSSNNYGAYTIYTNQEGTIRFTAGKSPSNVFNIVNQNNTGVYMASGATTFTSTSDARLKHDIVPLENAANKLMLLKPSTYKWKTQAETERTSQVGFIAQEVEEVLPELVNENTYPDGANYKGVATTDMIPYLIQSFQERTKEIKFLEQEYDSIRVRK